MPQATDVPVVIPAYEPGEPLLDLVETLLVRGFSRIVVVDDGSGASARRHFDSLQEMGAAVCVLRHAVNLGKGAALKTGLNFVLAGQGAVAGVVTADADGQHRPADIERVAAELCRLEGERLVIGARRFDGAVPLRSLLGNRLSAVVLRALVGQRLADTQSGLRGIPRPLIPHLLKLPANGYEFELDMLIACKHRGIEVVETPIETVYVNGNAGSHFNPLWDSMRIYFVLLRFALASLVTAAIDNGVFVLAYSEGASVLVAQLCGRAVAVLFNYPAARHAVFQSRDRLRETLPRFVALVAVNALLSYGMITFLHQSGRARVVAAKLWVEASLFLFNFAIQRDLVFTKRRGVE